MRKALFAFALAVLCSVTAWPQQVAVQANKLQPITAAPSGTCMIRNSVRLYQGTIYICPQSGTATWTAVGAASGDVVGPGSSTDNAVARFDLATGKILQNSVVLIGDTGNITGVGTLASGAQTITSAANPCFAVGPFGPTNPVLSTDCSVASQATGVQVIGRAAGAGVTLTATSSGTNEALNLSSKAAAVVNLGGTSVQVFGNVAGNGSFAIYDGTLASAGNRTFFAGYGLSVPVYSILSTGQFTFSSSSTNATSIDTGIARAGVGIARITNASTGVGALGLAFPPSTKTTGYTVLNTETGYAFDNIGASGSVTFTMPTPAAGLQYRFCRVADQSVVVDIGGSVVIQVGSSATTAGGNVSLDAVGSCLHVWAVSTTQWFGLLAGTATFN